jgi:DNA helicase-2/ATP-dependent DNA helicase PcrA
LRSRQESSTVVDSDHERTIKVQTAAAYLESLNPEQRRAVEHGAAGGSAAPPLLVIAGAGSGKTNTLAHRVAHLIVQGADPRRILLMTFSRRAASEMTKRVERIARKVMGNNAGVMTDALTWAGTYHGIGARLLREYAEQIGLDPAFTIHDREDSADLMNLVRHERGFSKTESRFPTKGTCLSIYSRCVNAEMPIEQVIGTSYPWCSGWAAELKELFAAYVEAKQKQNVVDYDDLLLYWAQMVGDSGLADGAIVISTPPGRASFPKSYSVCLSGRHGHSPRSGPRRVPLAKGPRWTSAPACGECGDRRIDTGAGLPKNTTEHRCRLKAGMPLPKRLVKFPA